MSDPAPARKTNPGATRRSKRRAPGRWPQGPQLTERDEEILEWMTRHGVVTAELVGRRFFYRTDTKQPGKWAAYRRLAALERMGLILRDKPFAKYPDVLRVTREGARISGVDLRPPRLIVSRLRHAIAVVWLAEGLAAQRKGAELQTERELRSERYRRSQGGEDFSRGRTADAILRIPTKGAGAQGVTRVAVELDLSRKHRAAMERMVRAYDHEREVDAVWWYVLPVRVERTRELVQSLRAADRFDVREWRGPT